MPRAPSWCFWLAGPCLLVGPRTEVERGLRSLHDSSHVMRAFLHGSGSQGPPGKGHLRPPRFPESDDSSFVSNAWRDLGLVTSPRWEEGVGIDDRGPSGSEIQIPVPKAVSLRPSPRLSSWKFDPLAGSGGWPLMLINCDLQQDERHQVRSLPRLQHLAHESDRL